jgi:hypothetical protein
MAQIIFLNERSHPCGDLHPAKAKEELANLIAVLVRIKKVLPSASLISAKPLPTLRLGNFYSVAIWPNEGGVAREQVRFLLGLGQRAPFRIVREMLGDADPGATIYRNDGDIVEGLGLAALYGGIPISFCGANRWRVSRLTLDVQQLVDDGESQWSLEIRHASLVEHVEFNRDGITSLRRRDVNNGAVLWLHKEELFPYLEFGPGVEADLKKLQSPAFLQVTEYLQQLNDAVEAWEPASSRSPNYPPLASDESASRKPLCRFPVPGGGYAAFTWHARYTPGEGRIHFLLKHDPKRVVIGYIGTKLGI